MNRLYAFMKRINRSNCGTVKIFNEHENRTVFSSIKLFRKEINVYAVPAACNLKNLKILPHCFQFNKIIHPRNKCLCSFQFNKIIQPRNKRLRSSSRLQLVQTISILHENLHSSNDIHIYILKECARTWK